MSSHGKPFYLYRRNRIYYARFKLPDGRLSPAKSTGETTKGRAERWAVEYLKAGPIVVKENVNLGDKMEKLDFGLDAPRIIINLFIAAGITFVIGVSAFILMSKPTAINNVIRLLVILFFLSFFIPAIYMILSSRIFKISNRNKIINETNINGSENILDVGCGRGLYAIGFANKLTTGHVYAIDIWNPEDISSNSESAIMENVRISGLEERIFLKTEDMRSLSFSNNFFDIVVASAQTI